MFATRARKGVENSRLCLDAAESRSKTNEEIVRTIFMGGITEGAGGDEGIGLIHI
jgi:hypothetical protein